MWYLAIHDYARWLAFAIIFCLFTDFLDGYLARKLNQSSSFGAKLDSAADNLLLLSVPFWIYRLRPEIIEYHPYLSIGFISLLVAVFFVMFIKFGRNVEIHTYASKLGVIIMWSFIVYTLLFTYSSAFFLLMIISSYYYLIEDLILLLTYDEVDEHIKGLFFFNNNK